MDLVSPDQVEVASRTESEPRLFETARIEFDKKQAVEDIFLQLDVLRLDGVFMLPYGAYSARYLSRDRARYVLSSYAGLKGITDNKDTHEYPIVYAPGELERTRGMFVLLAEQGVKPVEFDGYKTFYRYDLPAMLPSVLEHGYYQVPLRSCLYDELSPGSGWMSNRLAVPFKLMSSEVNQGDFAYGLTMPRKAAERPISLPETLKNQLDSLFFQKVLEPRTDRVKFARMVQSQVLLGGALLGVLQRIGPERIDFEEMRRANEELGKLEMLEDILAQI